MWMAILQDRIDVELGLLQRFSKQSINIIIMKKNILNLFILKVCIILVSCNSIQQKTPPIEDKVETTESVGVKEQSLVKAFLQELYDKYVFGNDGVCNFEDIVEHFSPKILTKLRNEFEYDGGGYAVWLFRTGAQDGPEAKSEVISISTEGDGWYTVFFSDMGIKSSCRLQVKIVEGKVFVTAFENGSVEQS